MLSVSLLPSRPIRHLREHPCESTERPVVTVEKISHLIDRAKGCVAIVADVERRSAFDEIVRRFQDMAFACAYAVLGDVYLAEDAAQEAFISAWRSLDQLRVADAFPGWFKRIVLTQCTRLTRNKSFEFVPMEAVAELAASDAGPAELYDTKDTQQQVMAAIRTLPEHERMVTALFYIGDRSTPEIADFLEVPLTTVKKRLFDARKHLRERMIQMDQIVRDTFKDQRPSRNDDFADTVRVFNMALESFVAKVKQDRYIIAAILFGSLSHDTVWRKSDIDIYLIGRDGDSAKGKEVKEFVLVEHGVNIHAVLFPRSIFKKMIEGSLQGSISHSTFALSTLLFTHDDTIRAYYDNARAVGAHDQRLRLMTVGGEVLYMLAKAEKWLITRKDAAYSFVWLTMCARCLAELDLLIHGQMPTRESLPQALKLNPALFNAVYFNLVNQPKHERNVQAALDRINAYLDQHLPVLFGPVLDYLKQEGGTCTTSQLETYFRKQTQVSTLSIVYEWLADKGVIQKVPMPLRLTRKSQVTVDEAAYYYEG